MAEPRIPSNPIPPSSVGTTEPAVSGAGTPVAVLPPPAEKFESKRLRGGELWLRRAAVLLFVILCAVVGVLLVVLPWSLQWTDNHLLWGHTELKTFLANGFVRGFCTGLGILDLWIGFQEATHYHEGPVAVK